MPIKSSGCALCRKRKIRCDEKRPGCERCKTHGVPCPGYRTPDPGKVLFRDQTAEIVSTAGKKTSSSNKGRRATCSTSSTAPDTAYPSPSSSQHTSSSDTTSPFSNFDLSDPPFERFSLQRNETALDFSQAMALYATPQYRPSPALEKSQIYSTFMDTYLPKRIGAAEDAHFSFLQHLISTPNLRPEVNDSLDALSMVQVGSVYKDTSLLRQSVKAYSKSLNGLLRILTTEDFIQDDYVLATVTIMATCEFFDEISQMGEGWSKHINGIGQLLEARGPDAVQGRLALLLFTNMKHGALSHALITRKATFMGRPEWREVAFRTPVVDNATYFYNVALQLPDLLERFDKLDASSPKRVQELDKLLGVARRLEKDLKAWFDDFKLRAKLANSDLYRIVTVDEFATFTSLVSDRTVDKAIRFPNFMLAYLISVYWDVMHFLRTCVKQLHFQRHEAEATWFPETDEMVTENELMEYAMNLCRCFPFFCEPSSSATGQIGLFLPLRTAALYFAEHGHWALLKWTALVRDSVFNKGMRPPSVREQRPAGASKMFVVKRPSTPVTQTNG